MVSLNSYVDRGKAVVATAQRRAPWFDHLARAASRYKRDSGDRLAAALTYYAFLSVFPLLLLALSVLGYVLARDPDLQVRALATLGKNFPGVYDGLQENLDRAMERRRAAGLVGLAGLLWAGLGWLGAMRDSLRLMWHHDLGTGNLAQKKAVDLATMLGLGVTLGLSVLITGVFAGSASWVLNRMGLVDHGLPTTIVTALVAFAIGVLADVALFAFLFTRLPRIDRPRRTVLRGALFAAVGFGVLKFAGRFYIAHFISAGSKVFGTFAVVAGLLVWINLFSRFVLYAAAWTVTAPYNDDASPSGTSSPEAAKAAGLSDAQVQAIGEPGVDAGSVLTKEPAADARSAPA